MPDSIGSLLGGEPFGPNNSSTPGPTTAEIAVSIFRISALAMAAVTLLAGCGDHGLSHPHAPTSGWNRPAPVSLPLRIAPDLLVKRVRFGLLKTTPSGNEEFIATDRLPAEEGANYGWIADVETTRSSVRWQERLYLPAPEEDWGDAAEDEDVIISQDGRTALSTGDDVVDDGQVRHMYWTLSTVDPTGRYEMDVAIEGHPVAHFEFHLDHPVHEKPMLVRYPRRTGAMPGLRIARNEGSLRWK